MDYKNNSTVNKSNAMLLDTADTEIKEFIKQLKAKKAYFFDIPQEYRSTPAIVSIERELGIRKSIEKGYDVINNTFFVKEAVLQKNYNGEIVKTEVNNLFGDFSNYFEFLQGDIYENACYYKYSFTQDIVSEYAIDLAKINYGSRIHDNIDEFTLEFTETEKQQYCEIEKDKIYLKKWTTKFNQCQTYDKFRKLAAKLDISNSSKLFQFFIFNFLNSNNKNKLEIITQYLNHKNLFSLEKALCLFFNPHEVLKAYDNSKFYTHETAKKWKSRLESFIQNLENDDIEFIANSYFDEELHYFVLHEIGRLKQCKSINGRMPTLVETYKYFETFEEMAAYLGNDLSNCDLSKAIIKDLDVSKYKIDEGTKLPISYQSNVKYDLKKYYDRYKSCFIVKQTWTNVYGGIIKNYSHEFAYFFDFVSFLKNDLTDANLLFCDGLRNISDFSDLNLERAVLRSDILDKLGASYEVTSKAADRFAEVESNELETAGVLSAVREELSYEETGRIKKIYYVTDLHLLHRLQNANCKSRNDELYVLQKIVDSLLDSVMISGKGVILIGGDTSSDFLYFELFIKLFRSTIDERNLDVLVIFTLGNHELWDFVGEKASDGANTKFDKVSPIGFDQIVEKYKKVIAENKMYLLQNNLIFQYDPNNIEEIGTEELKKLSKTELLNRLSKARLILFGGLGFAGYNEKFNANQYIYRSSINRKQEMEESIKFEKLYKKICDSLSDRRVIVFTHMPQKDWCLNETPIKGFIYVNGHTHRNYFYDDGDYRIYSDNQIGYSHNNCTLKYFYVEDEYDLFLTYKNGIYEITREEYINFYLGKNINMNFFRDFVKLYMLKKNAYYMFILQGKNGVLNILNGGAIRRLAYNKIEYYYENMDMVISHIKTPFDNFSNYQKQIADTIKSIGGSGSIHGAIIDIDFFNHLYVNPVDLTVTAYWASDIKNKTVFKDIPTLLQSKCPNIYANYQKQIEGKAESEIVLNGALIDGSSQIYLDTDIYRASRVIKKMQRLSFNILTVWIEPGKTEIE